MAVTVDDEGNWKIVDNPNGHDQSLLLLLQGVELGVYAPNYPSPGSVVCAGGNQTTFGAKVVHIDPPIESKPGLGLLALSNGV